MEISDSRVGTVKMPAVLLNYDPNQIILLPALGRRKECNTDKINVHKVEASDKLRKLPLGCNMTDAIKTM